MQSFKSLHFKEEKCTREKDFKVKISVLVGANCYNSKKLPLLVISKSKKSKWFQGVQSFPTKYEANTKSWMTENISEKYVRELVALFLNNKR